MGCERLCSKVFSWFCDACLTLDPKRRRQRAGCLLDSCSLVSTHPYACSFGLSHPLIFSTPATDSRVASALGFRCFLLTLTCCTLPRHASLPCFALRFVREGRFGIGFNSVYHLTELPAFVSAGKWCSFDPQAKFLPNVNPANPGKMVDFIKYPETVRRYPDQVCLRWRSLLTDIDGPQGALEKTDASLEPAFVALKCILASTGWSHV